MAGSFVCLGSCGPPLTTSLRLHCEVWTEDALCFFFPDPSSLHLIHLANRAVFPKGKSDFSFPVASSILQDNTKTCRSLVVRVDLSQPHIVSAHPCIHTHTPASQAHSHSSLHNTSRSRKPQEPCWIAQASSPLGLNYKLSISTHNPQDASR